MPTPILILAAAVIVIVSLKIAKRLAAPQKERLRHEDAETENAALAALKGAEGEARVAEALAKTLPPGTITLRNLLIPKHDGATTEIDLLAITPNGLLLIESKNLAGWIFGDIAGERWTQTLPTATGHAAKYHFLNPIRQNAAHLRHLQAHLAAHGHKPPIHSVIVFAGPAQLKSTPAYAPGHAITTLRHLPHAIAAILATHPQTLSPGQIHAIAAALSHAAHATAEERAAHVAAIHAQAAIPRCPRCGATLVPRAAAKGPNAGQPFLACPRYPQCRHTQPLDAENAER